MNESTLESTSLLIPDFVHPCEVLHNRSLPLAKKRAILSLWASDACAVESRPGFRWLPGTPGPILFDHIIKALRAIDDEVDTKRVGEASLVDSVGTTKRRVLA